MFQEIENQERINSVKVATIVGLVIGFIFGASLFVLCNMQTTANEIQFLFSVAGIIGSIVVVASVVYNSAINWLASLAIQSVIIALVTWIIHTEIVTFFI